MFHIAYLVSDNSFSVSRLLILRQFSFCTISIQLQSEAHVHEYFCTKYTCIYLFLHLLAIFILSSRHIAKDRFCPFSNTSFSTFCYTINSLFFFILDIRPVKDQRDSWKNKPPTKCEPYSLRTSLQKLPTARYEGKRKKVFLHASASFFTRELDETKLSHLEDPPFENIHVTALTSILQRHR